MGQTHSFYARRFRVRRTLLNKEIVMVLSSKGPITPVQESGALRRCTVGVFVHAESVAYLGQGVYRISMDGVELNEAQTKMVRELLPHTADQFYDLLAKEAILGSIFKGEVTQKMHDREEVFRPSNKD